MLSRWVLLIVIINIMEDQAERSYTEIRAYVGEKVVLPCEVDITHCGVLHSVKWYRETSRIYVYSQGGQVARAELGSMNRMAVQNDESGNLTFLQISSVVIEDEGAYKCEITYLDVRDNCIVAQTIKLVTLVHPESIQILNEDGLKLANASILAPKNEGEMIRLTCEARKGKPTPTVSWYRGGLLMENVTQKLIRESNGVASVISNVSIVLTRRSLNQQLECRVESAELKLSSRNWVTLDVNVKPKHMNASFPRSPITEGTKVVCLCKVFGAKPAATVSWLNNSKPVEEQYFKSDILKDSAGTFTTITKLEFIATRWENGRTIACEAENEVMNISQDRALNQNVSLDILFPPDIRMYSTKSVVNETENVIFFCSYEANPRKLSRAVWYKNDNEIGRIEGKYIAENVNNLSLHIENVTRDDSGIYNCLLKNVAGETKSTVGIYLDVYYTPSVSVSFEPPQPIRGIGRINVTMECSIISGNPPELQKVKWFLGEELIAELPKCNSITTDSAEVETVGPFCDVDPSVLSLIGVNVRFAGNYSCQGKNRAGFGPKAAPNELIVYVPPGPVTLRYYPPFVIKNQEVTLECSIQDPGIPENITYLWFRGEKPIYNTTSSNWTMQALLNTRNNFTCVAANAGGQSEGSTIALMVWAPPTIISKVTPYRGVLYNTPNFSLTCRIECFPICSVKWFENGHLLNTTDNPFYTVFNRHLPADYNKNDFESIESTLIWNLKNWPDQQLSKEGPPKLYTCESESDFDLEANFTTEVAVDYPPENLIVSQRIIQVVENEIPEAVECSGKGRPKLSYIWRKNTTSKPIVKDSTLKFSKMLRDDGGQFICEASNKYGNRTVVVYFDILYKPDCTVEMGYRFGQRVLICSANGNPSNISYFWRIRQSNETLEKGVFNEESRSYIGLDSSSTSILDDEATTTYQCVAKNSVGESSPCERFAPVTGDAIWSRHGTNPYVIVGASLLILLSASSSIVICWWCKRKKAHHICKTHLMDTKRNPRWYINRAKFSPPY